MFLNVFEFSLMFLNLLLCFQVCCCIFLICCCVFGLNRDLQGNANRSEWGGGGKVDMNILNVNICITSVQGKVREQLIKKSNLKTKIVISICCRGANIAKRKKKT